MPGSDELRDRLVTGNGAVAGFPQGDEVRAKAVARREVTLRLPITPTCMKTQ